MEYLLYVQQLLPALMVQLDARLTGDQEAAGSIPVGSATLFHGD